MSHQTTLCIVAESPNVLSRLIEDVRTQGHVGPCRPFPAAQPPLLFLVDVCELETASLAELTGVRRVLSPAPAQPLASRVIETSNHVVSFGDLTVGETEIVIAAGPCSVERGEGLARLARQVSEAGANFLRGGAFKPRTSPYAFQGLGHEGLQLLGEAREKTGIRVVTEVMEPAEVGAVAEVADLIQVGARNMQNFPLLRALGAAKKPVLLKRGFGCTIDELLSSAEYILAHGNPDVILCERGIRTFARETRFTFDLAAIAALKLRSRLPVFADPSHAAGDPTLVPGLALGAIAAGADGLLIEVHDDPEQAWSDGAQALLPGQFSALMDRLSPVAASVGRHLGGPR